MKRLLGIMGFMTVAVGGCRDVEEMRMIEFLVTMDSVGMSKNCEKAVFSGEIYAGNKLYMDLGENNSGQFQAEIPTDGQYRFLGWADFSHSQNTKLTDDYYNTQSLRAVGFNQEITNLNNLPTNRDCFSASCDITKNKTSLTLHKSAAQLVVISEDIEEIPTDFRPDSVAVIFDNTFEHWDVATNSARTLNSQKYTAKIAQNGVFIDEYLFAPTEGFLASFTATFYCKGKEILSQKISSIPLRTGAKTQLSGNFLTSSITITVTTENDWTDEQDITL